MIDPTADITGPYGTVQHVPYPDPAEPDMAPEARAAIEVGLGTWLITSPAWHPAWSQWSLSVVSLRDHPGLDPANLKFAGATHELLVLALHPDHRQTVETMTGHCRTGDLPHLNPVNVAEQFECTDDEARAVAWLAAQAVVNGTLPPEPPLGYESFRTHWLAACTKTLAHLRGEAHAS